MRSDVIPAWIVATAIVGSTIVFGLMAQRSADSLFESALTELEAAGVEKDTSGRTRITRITEGVANSVAHGFRAGFGIGGSDEAKRELDARDQLAITAVRVVSGGSHNQERVVGLIRNNGSQIVRGVSLNVAFKGQDGSLLDVRAKFADVSGALKPGDELGFEVERELGEFNEERIVLDRRRASSATVVVANLDLLE